MSRVSNALALTGNESEERSNGWRICNPRHWLLSNEDNTWYTWAEFRAPLIGLHWYKLTDVLELLQRFRQTPQVFLQCTRSYSDKSFQLMMLGVDNFETLMWWHVIIGDQEWRTEVFKRRSQKSQLRIKVCKSFIRFFVAVVVEVRYSCRHFC